KQMAATMTKTLTLTEIRSAWLTDMDWIDGQSALTGSTEINLPCVWLVNPANAKRLLGTAIPTLLNDSEQSRANRFHQQQHKTRFEVAHTTLRTILGRILDTDPARLVFKKGHHGKPLLEIPTHSS